MCVCVEEIEEEEEKKKKGPGRWRAVKAVFMEEIGRASCRERV